ncbi:MAG TPA: hypothetical protein VFM17_05485 [Candidatus Eisenbacteria bacterium]|nr:hypothetical protein [Candidatus Eisenbacteria bacterium]
MLLAPVGLRAFALLLFHLVTILFLVARVLLDVHPHAAGAIDAAASSLPWAEIHGD